MLSELSREQWQEALNIPTERLPQALILRGTRNLHGNTQKYRALLDDALDIWSPNALFEDLLLGYLRGTPVAYASVYGAAMASEITHLCAVLGAQRAILTGCCGALAPELQAGDLVCASAAHTGEGAAQYYLPRRRRVSASPELMDSLPSDFATRGPVWTTAALLAESIAELRAWREEEYIAVDMETASVYAVAEYFGIQRIALLFVFDNPLEGEHLLLSDSEKHARRAAGEQAMIAAALDLASSVAVA